MDDPYPTSTSRVDLIILCPALFLPFSLALPTFNLSFTLLSEELSFKILHVSLSKLLVALSCLWQYDDIVLACDSVVFLWKWHRDTYPYTYFNLSLDWKNMSGMCMCYCLPNVKRLLSIEIVLSSGLLLLFSHSVMSTFCHPMDCSTPGFPVLHHLLELAIQSSHPLSSPSPPAFNLSQHQGLFQWVASGGQSIGASASVLPTNTQDWFSLGLTGLISFQYKGFSRVFSNTKV